MLCVPIASAAVVKVAVVPEIAAEPRMVAPSLKVTVPLADDPPETVAVNCTWPLVSMVVVPGEIEKVLLEGLELGLPPPQPAITSARGATQARSFQVFFRRLLIWSGRAGKSCWVSKYPAKSQERG